MKLVRLWSEWVYDDPGGISDITPKRQQVRREMENRGSALAQASGGTLDSGIGIDVKYGGATNAPLAYRISVVVFVPDGWTESGGTQSEYYYDITPTTQEGGAGTGFPVALLILGSVAFLMRR